MVTARPRRVREDGGGYFGGQLLHCRSTAGLSVDPEGAKPGAEPCCGDRATGQVAGKQPAGLCWGAEALVAARRRELCPDVPGEWLVDADVATTEPDRQPVASVVDLPSGHRCDPRELLCVKQIETPRDVVDG